MNLRTLDLESHRSPSPFRVATRDIRLSTVVFEVEAASKEAADQSPIGVEARPVKMARDRMEKWN